MIIKIINTILTIGIGLSIWVYIIDICERSERKKDNNCERSEQERHSRY